MMTPPPIDERIDQIEDEEENGLAKARRGFQWRARLEQRAIGFAEKGSGGQSKHQGGRFAYQLRDEQRLKNVAGVPQAIVKVIPGGGVGSRGELVAQLNYLSRDGAQELERGDGPSGYQIEGQDAIRDVATDWAMAWEDAASRDGRTARAKSKTFHLLVSYPEGTNSDMAQMAAEAFTDQLCQSGEYGDRWRYIAAWHTDRPHPHMHIVIDRLGASGRMMQIHPAKTINPKSLRALQVDTAIEYGIALNDTPRVSRGHRDRALSSPEWRAEQRGERRERSPARQVYAKTASSFAEDAIGREANELKKLSERYQRADTPERRKEANALERAAFILTSGGTLDDEPQMTVRRRSDAKRGEEQKDKISEKAEELDSESPATKPDASTDRPSPARVPNRRLTEQELRELLNAKERELAERQRNEEEERQLGLGNAEPREPDIQTNDTGSANERESTNTAGRDVNEARSRRTERKKPLTEQELGDILSHGVQMLNEADKRRQIGGRDRDPDFEIGFD